MNWELIIVDDGSSDKSVEIVREFCAKDKRIILYLRLDSEMKGASNCRNIGIHKSHGEYLIFLDADDYIANYCLEQRVEYMEQYSQYDFVVFPIVAFKEKPYDCPNMFFGYKLEEDVLSHFLMGTLPFVVVSNIYRRSAIVEKELFWDMKLLSLQDSDYNIASILKNFNFAFANLKPDYYWRISGNSNSISKKIASEEHFVSRMYFWEKIMDAFLCGKRYKSELLVYSNLFYKIILYNSDNIHVHQFCTSKFFDSYPWLKLRLCFIADVVHFLKIRNRLFCFLLLLLLCPLYEIRLRYNYKKWSNIKRKIFKELQFKYGTDC